MQRATSTLSRPLACWLLALCALPGPAWSAEPAATVILLVGHAVAQNPADESIRTLAKGAPVSSGETISTDVASYANLGFVDGAFVTLRPLSKFQIEQFSVNARDAVAHASTAPPPSIATANEPSRSIVRLLRGGFRALSGWIGKGGAGDYAVNTPVATIGIRGTDFLAVLCSVMCASDPAMAGVPADAKTGEALVVGAVTGEIAVKTISGVRASLTAGQYGLVAADGRFFALTSKPAFIAADPYIGNDASTPANCGG